METVKEKFMRIIDERQEGCVDEAFELPLTVEDSLSICEERPDLIIYFIEEPDCYPEVLEFAAKDSSKMNKNVLLRRKPPVSKKVLEILLKDDSSEIRRAAFVKLKKPVEKFLKMNKNFLDISDYIKTLCGYADKIEQYSEDNINGLREKFLKVLENYSKIVKPSRMMYSDFELLREIENKLMNPQNSLNFKSMVPVIIEQEFENSAFIFEAPAPKDRTFAISTLEKTSITNFVSGESSIASCNKDTVFLKVLDPEIRFVNFYYSPLSPPAESEFLASFLYKAPQSGCVHLSDNSCLPEFFSGWHEIPHSDSLIGFKVFSFIDKDEKVSFYFNELFKEEMVK